MIHLEALTTEAQTLFPKLTFFSDFYLAGGTAVALQLGHRISVDFDLFTLTPLADNLLDTAEQVFGQTLQPLVNNGQELTFVINNVKTTFLTYPFPVVEPKISLDTVLSLSLPELGATKAYTIGRRGSFKDYVDLYSIVSTGHSNLEHIVSLAEKKYGDQFNGRLFLEQLLYLEDIKDTAITFLMPAVSKNDIELYFTEAIQKLKLE